MPCQAFSHMPKSVAAKHRLSEIPSGDAGTAATIEQMRKLVREARLDKRIRKLAGSIIQSCGQKDWRCYMEALFAWVRKNIKYVYDQQGIEVLQYPWVTVETKAGDCDDQAMLLSALAESIGLNTAFVTCRANPKSRDYSHVYLYIWLPRQKEPVAADTTMPYPLGWEPPKKYERRIWRITQPEGGGMFDALFGLGATPVVQNTGIRKSSYVALGLSALLLMWGLRR